MLFESPCPHQGAAQGAQKSHQYDGSFLFKQASRGMLFESPCAYQDTAQGGLIKSYCWIAQDRFLEQLVDFHRGLCLKNDFPRKHCQLALHFLQVAR